MKIKIEMEPPWIKVLVDGVLVEVVQSNNMEEVMNASIEKYVPELDSSNIDLDIFKS